jgi:hypothetical protein
VAERVVADRRDEERVRVEAGENVGDVATDSPEARSETKKSILCFN